MNTKVCRVCNEVKNIRDYNYHPTNTERLYKNCKACVSQYNKERRKSNPASYRNKELLRNYGITSKCYESMLKLQDYRCAICNVEEKEAPKERLHVDHCHTGGQVRSLLCSNCNTGIGLLRDSSELVTKAAEYLIKHGK